MHIRRKKLINWQYVLGLVALPFLIAALAWGIAQIQGQLRYDPAYFTSEYTQRYKQPSAVIADLEKAIIHGDAISMAILQGTRQVPHNLQPEPDIRFSIFWNEEGKYLNYLFFNFSTYGRYMKHLTQVKGRYIVMPENLYYYIDSGRWKGIWGPLSVFYWIIVALFTLGIWIYRAMARVRAEMYS